MQEDEIECRRCNGKGEVVDKGQWKIDPDTGIKRPDDRPFRCRICEGKGYVHDGGYGTKHQYRKEKDPGFKGGVY